MDGFYGYKYGRMRFWEMLPGALVWGTLILGLALSFFAPVYVVVFIIVFDLYWFFRVAYFIIFLVIAWVEVRRASKVDWAARVREIPGHERIHHLVFLPTYKEELSVIRATLRSLLSAHVPHERMIVVLAGEERDAHRFRKNAAAIEREFGHRFKKLIVTEHPAGLPDEIPGKGSNLNWAGHRADEVLTAEFPTLKDEDLIVSAFDVDTVVHPQYFSYLARTYLTVEDPLRCSYQPVVLFSNTIWTAPAPVRIAAFGTTFWLMGELARPERLWTFSSHSMPWKMLKDVRFWQKDIVSEDSRIFLQAFVHYRGDYRVTPLYLPVSMDAVSGETYVAALKALYKQQRRWAWGVEHLPAMVAAFGAAPGIPLMKKARYLFNHLEGMYTWATAPLLIFLFGQLPLALVRDPDALIQAAPFTLQHIMQLAMAGVFVSGILSLTLLPPRPASVKGWAWLLMVAQWLLLPVTFILFGALPAIDAQTRFLLGSYLGFNVTKKLR
ncbi:glycosyltransferase family 2 protein [Patescibacteria group bacterium]|nr:MAG: glycosyltransferase family 2 protein [Patescibacteria group bacterium]